MMLATNTPIYLAPAWVGIDKDGSIELIDGRDGGELSLTGTLRQAFLEGRFLQEPVAAAMARLNPMIERLFSSLVASDPCALDRYRLLRGAGWSRLFIELTGQCNERCEHCYASSSPDVLASLTESAILGAIDHAKSLGFQIVQLTGGDPLISPNVVPAARHARDIGIMSVEVYTNGLALKGRLFEELRDLNVAFAFSVYGQDPLVHDAVTRVSGSHRRTLEAIERAASAGLEVRAGIIDTGQTGFNLEETIKLTTRMGVPENAIGTDFMREVGRGTFQQEKGAEQGGARPPPAPLSARDFLEFFSGAAAVSYTGEVYPCIFSRNVPLGSVYESTLTEILEDPSPIDMDWNRVYDRAMSFEDKLTCWKCRLRAALLTDEQRADS